MAANKQLPKRSRTKKSLCNLNMVADIFTLSLNGYIYNEGNMPDEILIHRRDLCQRDPERKNLYVILIWWLIYVPIQR